MVEALLFRRVLQPSRRHARRPSFYAHANPSNLRASLAPLVLVTQEALDELAAGVDAVALVREG